MREVRARVAVIFKTYERDNGDFELKLDVEGIDYLEEGLRALRSIEAGAELSCPSLTSDDDEPLGVASFILLRADDE